MCGKLGCVTITVAMVATAFEPSSATSTLPLPPPSHSLSLSQKHGVVEEVKIMRRRPKGGVPYDETVVKKIPGYVGLCKGSDQYLWERGLYFEKRETINGNMAPMVLNLPKDDPHERTEEWSQVHILSNLYDFANEQSALEKKYIDRGDIPLFCAKGHPELAGKGVEFCWGVSKRNFRKINDSVGKNLHANILKSFEVLDLATTCRCSRRTRRYRAGYASGAGTKSYEEVEKFVAHHKCHRNIFDQEKKWIKQELNKHGIDVGY